MSENVKSPAPAETFDDLYPAIRYNHETHQEPFVEQSPVRTVLNEVGSIALGGFNYLREHPVGSIEVGSAIAASGIAAAAALFRPWRRHQPRFVA